MIEIRHISQHQIDYLTHSLKNIEKDRAIQSGLRSAGNVFASGGKRRLRSRMKSGRRGVTGNLLKSFKVKVKRNKPGVLIGFKQGKDGGSHVHLVDQGTEKRYWKTKKRKYVGRVIATNFWSDTEAQDSPEAMDKVYMGIEKAVTRISNRQ